MLRKMILSLVFVSAIGCASSPTTTKQTTNLPTEVLQPIPSTSLSPLAYADQVLLQNGFDENFIKAIHQAMVYNHPHWEFDAKKVLELNIFGFLGHANYSVHYSTDAIRHIKKYLRDHKESFSKAHTRNDVSPSSIASLLWVETKFGKITGSYPVASVYYSLILGSHPDYTRAMLALTPEKLAKGNPKNLTLVAAQNRVIERCKSKADWALEELKALRAMQTGTRFNPFRTKSSFAGAMGIPQFIPSTFQKFAISQFRKRPDLNRPSDAIASVANFLQSNGWKESDPESKSKALFAYNRSKDYGDVILKLASEVK